MKLAHCYSFVAIYCTKTCLISHCFIGLTKFSASGSSINSGDDNFFRHFTMQINPLKIAALCKSSGATIQKKKKKEEKESNNAVNTIIQWWNALPKNQRSQPL